MAIPILEQRKKLKKLIPILVVVILITALNFWRGFAPKNQPPSPPPEGGAPIETKKVEIEWATVKNKALDDLDLFPALPELTGEAGRDNPFNPY